jgi:hypothetical protein
MQKSGSYIIENTSLPYILNLFWLMTFWHFIADYSENQQLTNIVFG